MKVRTFSEEHMGSPVHDTIADREVVDDSVHGLLRRRDEVDAVHRTQGLSLLVDIFYHCERDSVYAVKVLAHSQQRRMKFSQSKTPLRACCAHSRVPYIVATIKALLLSSLSFISAINIGRVFKAQFILRLIYCNSISKIKRFQGALLTLNI